MSADDTPDHQVELPRLHHAPHPPVVEGEVAREDRIVIVVPSPAPRLTRRNPRSCMPRGRDRREAVAHVELHRLRAGPRAGVPDVELDVHLPVRRDLGRAQHEARQLERRVAEAVAERKERRRLEVRVAAAPAVLHPVRLRARLVVRDGQLARVAGNRHRQLAARRAVAEQDLGHRLAAPLAGNPRLDDGGHVRRDPPRRERTAVDEDDHGRLAGRYDGPDEVLLQPGELEGRHVAAFARRAHEAGRPPASATRSRPRPRWRRRPAPPPAAPSRSRSPSRR